MAARPEVSARSVAASVEAGDHVAALDKALALWRRHRQGMVADLIDAIAAKCRPVPISGRDSPAFQAAWIDLATGKPEAAAIGALVASLAKRVPVREVGYLTPNRDLKKHRPFLDRIEALAELPPDPRTASALLALLERAPYGDSRRVYEPVVALLQQIGDDRSAAALERLAERPTAKASTIRDYFAQALPAAAAEIEALNRVPLPAGDRALVDATREKLGGKRPKAPAHREVGQLFDECLARPDDNAPRAVLADALLEREDPRGELITLQLRGDLGEPEQKRVAALLRQNEKRWLGDLARVTKLRVWRGGFLDEAELQNHAVADDETWKRAASDPRLATLRVLHKGRCNAELYRAFVFSPQLTSLREVTVPSVGMLEAVVAAGKPLDHVVLEAGITRNTAPLLAKLVERTGAKRLTFTTSGTPDALIDRVLQGLPIHTHFDEICVAPASRVYQVWGREAATWLRAHDRLRPVRRLGIQFSNARVVAEAGSRKPRIEIHTSDDWSLPWVISNIGTFEHLAIRGRVTTRDPRPDVVSILAKIPAAALELHDGWERMRPRARLSGGSALGERRR